jgi:hypothetical protein
LIDRSIKFSLKFSPVTINPVFALKSDKDDKPKSAKTRQKPQPRGSKRPLVTNKKSLDVYQIKAKRIAILARQALLATHPPDLRQRFSLINKAPKERPK